MEKIVGMNVNDAHLKQMMLWIIINGGKLLEGNGLEPPWYVDMADP